MYIVCSWCRRDGQIGIVGEKDPLEDRRETHGICLDHLQVEQRQWRENARTSAKIDSRRLPVGTDRHGVVLDARDRFAFSAAHLWSGLKNLARKAAGF